jgi:hypothetical protein
MVKVTLSFAASPPDPEDVSVEDDVVLDDEVPEFEPEFEFELPESFLPEHAVRTRDSTMTRDNVTVSHRFFDTVFLIPFLFAW